MALKNCEDCGKEISTAAPACPHCGRPQVIPVIENSNSGPSPLPPDETLLPKTDIAPLFLIIAAVCFVITLGTPRILLTVPTLITILCASVSIFRKEPFRIGSIIIVILSALLFVVNAAEMNRSFSSIGGSGNTADLEKAEVTDYNWNVDPTFGGRGTVKWNVKVKNLSDRPMSMVGVQFTTYDANKKLITTTKTYVHAIPPGQERSEDSYADLYGNETTATAVIESVMYGD